MNPPKNMITPHPTPGFNFKVDFQPPLDNNSLGFLEVSGLEIGTPSEEIKLPKRLLLTRGLRPFSEFSQWYTDALEHGKSNSLDIEISLLGREGKPIATWKVVKAKPTAWYLDPINAMHNSVAVETLELSYAAIHRIL